MIAHLPCVLLQKRFSRRVVLSIGGVQVGINRHFRIDHDAGTVGQADDHVGGEPAAVSRDRLLLEIIAIRHHPGSFDDAAKLHLAPSSTLIRRSQCADQFVGLDLKRLVGMCKRTKLLVELGIRACAILLDFVKFSVNPFQ